MKKLSNDQKINILCNKLIATNLWCIFRKGKHLILKHLSKGATKIIIVPSTPSDSRAYSNFRKDYFRYLREYLILSGTIIR